MHADTNTQAEETHTERHFQLRCKPTDRILYSSCFVDFKHIVWSCLKNDKTLKTQLKEGGGESIFYNVFGSECTNTHTHTYTHIYVFLAAKEAPAKASPVASSRPVLLNERSLAAERNSLSWQCSFISFLSYLCHRIHTITHFFSFIMSPSPLLPFSLPSLSLYLS